MAVSSPIPGRLSRNANPKLLSGFPLDDLYTIRQPLLEPLDRTFRAPNRVALYAFADGSWVVENFNYRPATEQLDGANLEIAPRGWHCNWK